MNVRGLQRYLIFGAGHYSMRLWKRKTKRMPHERALTLTEQHTMLLQGGGCSWWLAFRMQMLQSLDAEAAGEYYSRDTARFLRA